MQQCFALRLKVRNRYASFVLRLAQDSPAGNVYEFGCRLYCAALRSVKCGDESGSLGASLRFDLAGGNLPLEI